MADRVEVRGTQVKLRSPWGAFLLSLITLGIYYLVLYYRTNAMRRPSPMLGCAATGSGVAATP